MLLKIKDGEINKYPYSLDNLRQDYPNVSFPRNININALGEYGVYPVYVDDEPFIDDPSLTIERKTPELIEGRWVQGWNIIPQSVVRADTDNRIRRTALLKESDIVILKYYEQGIPVPAAWVEYRQKLRDITNQSSYPYNLDWPITPQE